MQSVSVATIAATVRRLRQDAGLTQQGLADRADLSLRTVTRIEAGEEARVVTLTAIANVLGVSISELLAAA